MNNNNYTKRMTGVLLGYYRKRQFSHITQENYIKDTSNYVDTYCHHCLNKCNTSSICTSKTLRSIEQGHPARNICFYHRLALKIRKSVDFTNNPDFIQIRKSVDFTNNPDFIQIKKRLYASLNTVEFSQLQQIKNQLIQLNYSQTSVLYYSEFSKIYLSIIDLFLEGKCPSDEIISLSEYTLYYLDSEDYCIVSLLLFYFYTDFNINHQNTQKLIDSSHEYLTEPIMLRLLITKSKRENEFTDFYEQMKSLEKSIDTYSGYHQVVILDNLAFCEMNMTSYSNARNTLERCIKICEKTSAMPLAIYNKMKVKKSIVLYLLQDYDQCANLLSSVAISSTEFMNRSFFLLFHSLEKTNQIFRIQTIISNLDFNRIPELYSQKIVHYYRMKHCMHNVQYNDLEDYLSDHLYPRYPIGIMYIQILEIELQFLAQKTGNYKKFHEFKKKYHLLSI